MAELVESVKTPILVSKAQEHNDKTSDNSKGDDGGQNENEQTCSPCPLYVFVNPVHANKGSRETDKEEEDGVLPWYESGGDEDNGDRGTRQNNHRCRRC